MDTSSIYDSLEWELARRRALSRDGHRCTVARLLGGDCSPGLDVHHVRPLRDGGAAYDLENLMTCCDSHHPALEGLRRSLLRARYGETPRPALCTHRHQSEEARRLCEARMRRQRERLVTAA